MGHQWFNRNFMKLQELFLCAKKTKIMTQQFFSSMSVFNTCSQQYHNTCVWCCWHMSRRSDVEPRCAAPCFQAEEWTRMRRGTLVNACWNYGWTTDVMYNVLMMFLLPFGALNMVVAMLSMQGQKALGFHQKYLKVTQILKYCSKTVRFSSLGYKTRY